MTAVGSPPLPPEAFAASLAGFHLMTVARLRALLTLPADEAFAVAAGSAPAPPDTALARILGDARVRDAWQVSARRRPPAEVWARCRALGIDVSCSGGVVAHPATAANDPLPCPVLFSRGDRSLLDERRVAIVGTRNATAAGRDMAVQLGRGLAHAGVHVVSGLARGIDAHAHRGVLEAHDRDPPVAGVRLGCPIGVVACGLDHVYPREHRTMWERVATDGLLLSEHPPGEVPEPHRFPLRNRLVAGMSELVVVVESRERGGSLITAALAGERGVPVMAVPGATRNRAALGVNELLRDGATPVLDVGDVLVALSLDHARTAPLRVEQRPPPRPADLGVYRACALGPGTIGEIAARVDADLLTVAMSLARLEQQGWLSQVDGWYEAVGSPPR